MKIASLSPQPEPSRPGVTRGGGAQAEEPPSDRFEASQVPAGGPLKAIKAGLASALGPVSDRLDQARGLVRRVERGWSSVATQVGRAAVSEVAANMDLPEEAAPRLPRPLLMVHGYMGDAGDFAGMTRWLGRDGANRSGGVIPGGQPWEADPEADYFVLEFSNRWNPIQRNVAELKAAVEEICRSTGAAGVDLVVHSKAGLDARSYLMDPDEKVEHVLLLGTPNHGTVLADLELFSRENLSVPVFPPRRDPNINQCLRELSVVRPGPAGEENNPVLHKLNQEWEIQRGRAEFMNIAGAGIPTVSERMGFAVLGDGTVTETSARLPGIPFKRLWFRVHPLLPFSKTVMREMVAFVKGTPLHTELDLFDSPSERRAAAASGMLDEASRADHTGYLIQG